MPSSIPYDPSLVLANVVSEKAIQAVTQIAAAQAPVDAASENLNALLASRRSLDMTGTELQNLGIDTHSIDKAVADLNKDITEVASDYIKTKITAEKTIAGIRATISGVHSTVETPVDYVRTQIKTLPLASDSLNMDVQYFSLDQNQQDAKAFSSQISSYITRSMAFLGTKSASNMATTAQKQVDHQVSKHSITGTLVISVSCTHKNAHVLAPFILNVDKGIHSYNKLFPGSALDPTQSQEIMALAQKDGDDSDPKINIISGMTYGSSFVGMVHVLNSSSSQASQKLDNVISNLQSQMDAGAWFEQASGGYGVNSSFANNVKSLLSQQSISSHVTLISMGIIPSMVANEVKLGVQQFASFDPKSTMEEIATISSSAAGEQNSAQASAQAARTGQQMIAMKAGTVKAALSALGDIQDGSNKILDINSMMNALDDYLKKASEGTGGVPINYYLKEISKKMLAEMWVAKYYPKNGYIKIQEDDSGAGNTESGGGGATESTGNASSSGDAGASTGGATAGASSEPPASQGNGL